MKALYLLVSTVSDTSQSRTTNTYGERLELGSVTFVANATLQRPLRAVINVTKNEMVAYSNGIVLGAAGQGSMVDWREGARSAGQIRLRPPTPVALFAYPEYGVAVLAHWGRLTGQASQRRLKCSRGKTKPRAGRLVMGLDVQQPLPVRLCAFL